ncbi:MAG: 30S ribosomal protein S4 [Deltaproteobacteria bacterium]|nr:30S ribosomal protein S4 [Deltaproteobacteria bacterium]
MARYTGPVTKLSRREGINLQLKGDRSFTDKDSFERKPYPPGQHGQARQKFSEYGTQLREKQKIKRIYGVLEKQFRKIFKEADRQKGVTGENLIKLLESRLDNMVYRAGLARSRPEARVWVAHGHYLVNGQKIDRPSYFCKEGDVITMRDKTKAKEYMKDVVQTSARRGVPEWIALEESEMKATIRMLPVRNQITMPMNEQLVVELFSK